MKTVKSHFGKDFILVVIGQIISLFGNAILRFALPLYLLRQTNSPALFGLVSACSFLPMIVLSLLGGVLADRVNKRNIMVVLDFCTAGLILLLSFALGRIPVIPLFIVVLMLLYSISGAYQPAVQASIPALVPEQKLMIANAVINQVNTLSGLLGPVIGGIMFGMWGIRPILMLSIVCFFLSAVMELFIQIPFIHRKTDQKALVIVKNDLMESFHFIKVEKPVFLSIMWIICAFNLVLSTAIVVGTPIMVVQTLGLSDALLGFTQGALACGGLAGGLITAVASEHLRLSKSYLALLLCTLTTAAIGFSFFLRLPAMVIYSVITLMNFIAMAASSSFAIQMFAAIQQQTPPHMVGKVMAALMSISMCAHPVGQAIYGLLFDVFSSRIWVVVLGAAAASLVVAVFSRKSFAQLN